MSNDERTEPERGALPRDLSVIAVRPRITKVTVYEDRAEVVRTAEVELPRGACTLSIAGLSPVISDDHVVARVTADGRTALVNDVKVVRHVEKDERKEAEHRARVAAELRTIDEDIRDKEMRLGRHNARGAALRRAIDVHIDAARKAAGSGDAQGMTGFGAGLAALERSVDDNLKARLQATQDLEAARRKRAKVAGTAQVATPTGQRTVADVQVAVSGDGGSFQFVLSTLVPCAAWRPTHEARLVDGDGGKRVKLTSFAAVWQRTGESWDDVELVLSTARPSAGAELPPLLADRLSLRMKTAEERRTVIVEHRDEGLPKSATQGSAPGVDDGGEARVFRVKKATIRDDGRPQRVQVSSFEATASVERVVYADYAPFVFWRATLKNPGPQPVLAGGVDLVMNGGFVGTGDVLFVGAGEEFDLSFGTDDRIVVKTRRRRVEEKKLVGRDLVHFVREATLVLTAPTSSTSEKVTVVWRMPVSEVKQLKVIPSAHHCTEGEPHMDDNGIVKLPVALEPHRERKVTLGFSFDTSGDVRLPDPW